MKFSIFVLLASVVSTSGFANASPKAKAGAAPAKKAEPAKKAAPVTFAPKKEAPKKKK